MQHGLYLPRAMKSHINAQCCYSLSSFTLYRYQNHSVQIHLFQYSSFTKDCKIDFQSVKLMANKSCTTRKGFHSVCWLLSSKIMNSVSWVRFCDCPYIPGCYSQRLWLIYHSSRCILRFFNRILLAQLFSDTVIIVRATFFTRLEMILVVPLLSFFLLLSFWHNSYLGATRVWTHTLQPPKESLTWRRRGGLHSLEGDDSKV